jgi:outer membrane protein assembly factor BamE (lipoprotein component of BamABCDE complex)
MNIKKNKLLLLGATCAIIAACTPTVAQRGNMLEDHQLTQVVTGIHTRSDVLRILGSPTAQAPFNENIWYYIGQKTEKRGILDPEVTDERIVAVRFDEAGTVQAINEVKDSRMEIPIERSKTATHGNDVTFMQQMFGNLGRFNPQDQKK